MHSRLAILRASSRSQQHKACKYRGLKICSAIHTRRKKGESNEAIVPSRISASATFSEQKIRIGGQYQKRLFSSSSSSASPRPIVDIQTHYPAYSSLASVLEDDYDTDSDEESDNSLSGVLEDADDRRVSSEIDAQFSEIFDDVNDRNIRSEPHSQVSDIFVDISDEKNEFGSSGGMSDIFRNNEDGDYNSSEISDLFDEEHTEIYDDMDLSDFTNQKSSNRSTVSKQRETTSTRRSIEENKSSIKSSLFSMLKEEQSTSDTDTNRDSILQDIFESLDESKPIEKQKMSDLLTYFYKEDSPPPEVMENLNAMQLWLECESQRESVKIYEAAIESAREREDYTSLNPVRKNLTHWYSSLKKAIEDEQRAYLINSKGSKDRVKYGPFLCSLHPGKLAVIAAHVGCTYTLHQGENGAKLTRLALELGSAVEAEVNVQRVLLKNLLLKKKFAQAESESESENKNNEDTQENPNETSDDSTSDLQVLGKADAYSDWMYGPSHLAKFVEDANRSNVGKKKAKIRIKMANRRALKLLNDENEWSATAKAKVGAYLVKILLDNTEIVGMNKDNGRETEKRMAFKYEKMWVGVNRKIGFVTMDPEFYHMIVDEKYESLAPFSTRHKPMVVPPRPWCSPVDGGYAALKVDMMRTHGSRLQKDVLYNTDDLSMAYDGLNALGKVPWIVNKDILKIAQDCWDNGIALGDVPTKTDFEVPPEPFKPEPWDSTTLDKDSFEYKKRAEEYFKYRELSLRRTRINQKNMDLRSLRCSLFLKLNQAEQFKDFKKIYFPFNMDFRGRAYPVPPHLSIVGSDLCRGILKFSEAKPLGERGFYWLKVHLANLAGNDKISFDERAEFTEKNMELVRDSVQNPIGGKQWWMTCDDPFQALATCFEIVKAIDSGDPHAYECSLPVHMDGSCNGLQHYAALGRDKVGGTAVNLCPCDKPQDVYSGVMNGVIKRVAEEAERSFSYTLEEKQKLSKKQIKALKDNSAAKLVNGLIDRGVVKRTVMTSVYGVTFIGAKKQIQEKIEEKLAEKGIDVDEIENEIYAASGYLASVTMDVIGDLFTGAKETMNWLTTCARLIGQEGSPVSWISPVNVPIVQPYRRSQPYTIITLFQHIILSNSGDSLPVHKTRQVSAFPPNYVHSLDSSHMLLTALEMDKRGLAFSAVHDSFWTHPCDIDEMNGVLRDCFVDLYSKPLLEELKESWELRYPDISFPDIPKRGTLDLNDVKKAPYFFQ